MPEGQDQSTTSSAGDENPVKVMLAEDDSEDQELFEQALERTGVNAELTVVDNGKRIVEKPEGP